MDDDGIADLVHQQQGEAAEVEQRVRLAGGGHPVADGGVDVVEFCGVHAAACPVSIMATAAVSSPAAGRSRRACRWPSGRTRSTVPGRAASIDSSLPVWSCTIPVAAVSESRWNANGRSEERRVGKECRSRWSPY